MKRIQKIISLIAVVTLVTIMSVQGMAQDIDNTKTVTELEKNLSNYLMEDNELLLVVRSNYGYMKFAQEARSNIITAYLMEMTDIFGGINDEPDQEKYREVLINIIATYEMDNASNISAQKTRDNLKSFDDYAMDFVEMGNDAISIMTGINPGASELETAISTAISGLSTLINNTDNWLKGLSDLETIVQNYSDYDLFLQTIEKKSEGELKKAAKTLRMGMAEAMNIKLNTYLEISNENFGEYEEFFFSDVFFDTLKQIPEYESDETLKFFVDAGDDFFSKANLLKASWELGTKIGTLVGDFAVGGEDLINRIVEVKALYDISVILQNEILETGNIFLANYGNGTAKDSVEEYVLFSQYLIGCRIRGEYCLYSLIANDAGLLSWFNKELAEDTKAWYDDQIESILRIQEKLLKILEEDVSDNVEFENIDLFSKLPESFLHSGGVGGWGETLNINEDGSFSGIYRDSDSGASPKEWICRYNGKLGSPQKIEEGVYSAKVEELNLEEEPGKSYMENGVKYTYVTPAGMKNADAVDIYVPGCPIGKIPEEASNWVYLYGLAEEIEVPTGTYLIYNKNEERMFIGEIQKDSLFDENKLNSETETSNIEWLNVNQEYEQYDFDADGLNDSIALNLGEQTSGEAVIYINGQEAYVLHGTEGTYASYCIITLANGMKFIYAELADSAYYSEEQIILKIKGNTLEKVVDFEQLMPEYEVRHYLGRRGVDKYDSISVKENVITMEYCTNNFTVGVATISIDFRCQDNGSLESDYTGNVKKIVFSTTGERYLDETYEYEAARDIETYTDCQNPQTLGIFISAGERVTIQQYCIADGIIWFQVQCETGETGWVKGIISNAPYEMEAALFSNAYGAG